MRLFISYARADEPFVRNLAERLSADHDVWYDQDMIAGQVWSETIRQRLDWCECFVFVLSRGSLDSTRCIQEYQEAVRSDKPVIAARVQAGLALPDDMGYPRYVDFADTPFDAALDNLAEMLGWVTFNLSLQAPPPAPAAVQPGALPAPEEPELADEEVALPRMRGSALREKLGEESKAEVRHWTKPEFSAFYPGLVEAGKPYALMAFVHGEDAVDQVREVAAGFAGLMGEEQTSGRAASRLAVDVGDLITFVPRVAGIAFAPTEQTVAWEPPYQYATFLFTTPSSLEGDLEGRVLVYQGPLIIGEIPVRMQVASVSQGVDQQGTFERYDPVFASYSHRDRPVMEFFRQLRMSMGQRMLVDIYDLRAGEHWSERLLEMIDESAVFQLFWSRHSAESAYCRQEWEHALRYGEERPRFIQPVWWQRPMPAPPPELADLHFQKVAIPAGTWIELAGARVRDWFSRG
ncbi:MAG: toll/interleukin-1 receptor domain-containing protein [Chloroflexota bacterium]